MTLCDTRCGYAALIGAPNAGKSTLLNTLVGSKISIVSRKVQTTRCRITGIVTDGSTQIVLVDTPGVFDPKKPLEKAMERQIWPILKDVEAILFMVDAAMSDQAGNREALARLLKHRGQNQPVFLVLNKIDWVTKKEALLDLAAQFNALFPFAGTLMISAENGDGVRALLDTIIPLMPDGPWLYPEDQVTDVPLKLLTAEVTREQLFDRLHEELPYQLMVETETYEERPDGSLSINQNIVVGRDTHKGMVIGKGGAMIREIGSRSRAELEKIFEVPVHLFLNVLVDPDWAVRADRLRQGGLM